VKEYIDAANAILTLVAAQKSSYQISIAGRNHKLIEFVESKQLPGAITLILEPLIDPDEGPLPFGERIEILVSKHNPQRILERLANNAFAKDQTIQIFL
jgi:hypothetical protein